MGDNFSDELTEFIVRSVTTGYSAEISSTVLADAHDGQISGFKKFFLKLLKMMLSS